MKTPHSPFFCVSQLFRALAGASVIAALVSTLAAQTAQEVWVKRYNGPGNSTDSANATAVDSAGNVVVTGASTNASGNTDYYTAKYALVDGALLWEQRYNGPGDGADTANAIAVDSAGNVIVTGASTNASGNTDFYTAKYAAADGALLWEQRYNGQANGADTPSAIVLDSAGDVIVTGQVTAASGFAGGYTIKYAAANGTLLWEQPFGGDASDVAVDGAGNVVVVSGFINTSSTAKYAAANGALLWRKSTPPADELPFRANARHVAVDAAGNVAITGIVYDRGSYYYTAKYAAADGALLWQRDSYELYSYQAHANAVVMDAAGNVYVTGQSQSDISPVHYDYKTLKYASADGASLWEKRYAGVAGWEDFGKSIALDVAGNVVVTGMSLNNLNSDYYTAKYAGADGALLWEQRYNGPANGNEWMPGYNHALALTPDGGAIITGGSSNISDSGAIVAFEFSPVGPAYDYATVRYAPPAGDADGDGLPDWWELMWWGTIAGHSALDDFDRDGVPELLELAFGLNPKVSDRAAMPPVTVEGGYLTITITKHGGVTYEVQTAGDVNAASFSAATTTVLVNDTTTLKVRDNILIGTPPARYLRVKVTGG